MGNQTREERFQKPRPIGGSSDSGVHFTIIDLVMVA